MAPHAKMNRQHSSHEDSLFEHSRNLLADVWDHWIAGLNYKPETAKKKMMAGITKFHKAEIKTAKKVKAKLSKVKKTATRKSKAVKKSLTKKRSAK